MNGPASSRWPFRPGANRPKAPRNLVHEGGRGAAGSGRRRTLTSVLARHAARVRSRRALLVDLGKALLLTLLAALAAAPLAVVWGISHAQVDDYLGPHRVNFASNFHGEVEVDLGPIGNAYLASPIPPIGLIITVAVSVPRQRISTRCSQSRHWSRTPACTPSRERLSPASSSAWLATPYGKGSRLRQSCCWVSRSGGSVAS